jgi:hypothetical protein
VAHVRESDDGGEDLKVLGLYRTEARAAAAVENARTLPGFRDTPDGFSITAYLLDVDSWTEGYTTVHPDDET